MSRTRHPSGSSSHPQGPGRPRQADIDARLQSAVLTLLRDRGPTAVTVEGVAGASGIAKTTIYRRYANRADLLTAALTRAIGVPQVPLEGTVRDKMRFALEQAWRQMSDILGTGGLAAIVGNTDPEFTHLFRAALQPYDQALVEEIRKDSEAGLLRANVDADGIVSLLIGAYLGELVRRGEVAPDWLGRSLDMLWPTMVST